MRNFFAQTVVQEPAFGLTNPAQGAAANAARAALGPNASFADILDYVAVNNPELVTRDGDGDPIGIRGAAGDPDLIFTLSQPNNIDETATLDGWEFAVQHAFWDTGFGAILNYTIVNSDSNFDNTRRYTEQQFAVSGVSDSANAVVYFDKYGIQARAAYNWRDGFLASYGLDPFYVDSYGQLDVNVAYEFDNGLMLFAEGINVTNSDRRGTMRDDQIVYFAAPGKARYAAGVRFSW